MGQKESESLFSSAELPTGNAAEIAVSVKDFNGVADQPLSNREGPKVVIEAPESWRRPAEHLQNLLTAPWYPLVLELFSILNFASHTFFNGEGASVVFAPATTGSVSSPMGLGSDSVPVCAHIGGRSVYLADSMQFALELALRVTGKSAYYVAPSFRGEQPDARHLNQFVHAEAEICGGLDTVIELVERYFRFLTRALLAEGPGALDQLSADLTVLESVADRSKGFPRVRFDQAVRMLDDCPGAFEPCGSGDLRITAAGERVLLARYDSPVWLTHMPSSTVPFYQALSPNDAAVSLTADLIAGTGEVVGAGERARSETDVLANLERCNVASKDYGWYLEMKQRKPWRTAGFGLGLERYLLWATGTRDIRDWAFLLRNEFGEGRP